MQPKWTPAEFYVNLRVPMRWYTFMNTLGRAVQTVGCVPCKRAKVSSRGQSTTVTQRKAKPFDPHCKTIRSALQNHSIRVAKPFDPRCKTIRSALQNHSIRIAKPVDTCCQTIQSALQNHSICVTKPFEPCCQTIRSLINY